MSEAVLSLTNVEASYGPVKAIRGVSLSVPSGGIVTVLGANGAGKTTVLRTISGVLEPTRGEIRYRGQTTAGIEPEELVRRGIAHVPEGREIFPLLSVRENLMMGAYTRRDRDQVGRDLEAVLGYFSVLRERSAQPGGLLSGGEQQMLAIGRAMMSAPRLLLLDEPSLGLAPKLVQEIFAIVRQVNRERGTTVLLVEQNARLALEVAEYGYVLEVGRIVLEDRCERLRQKDDVREFYLGMRQAGVRGRHRWKRRKTWR